MGFIKILLLPLKLGKDISISTKLTSSMSLFSYHLIKNPLSDIQKYNYIFGETHALELIGWCLFPSLITVNGSTVTARYFGTYLQKAKS